MLIPSLVDPTLAPAGKHVASLFCQHANPQLPGGSSWDDAKEEVSELMLDTVDRYAPGFRASVIARRALSPLDLEREFGLTNGDIFHGQLTFDQLFSARPVLGHGNYRGPLKGLYMRRGRIPAAAWEARRAGPGAARGSSARRDG
jgi:phytoene dehydrogenase-like protein